MRRTGPPILTRAETALVLGVHPSTISRWADGGLLPHIRTPSGERRYRRGDVEGLLNQRPAGQPHSGPGHTQTPAASRGGAAEAADRPS
jgi:excisionase family DNA binding protein